MTLASFCCFCKSVGFSLPWDLQEDLKCEKGSKIVTRNIRRTNQGEKFAVEVNISNGGLWFSDRALLSKRRHKLIGKARKIKWSKQAGDVHVRFFPGLSNWVSPASFNHEISTLHSFVKFFLFSAWYSVSVRVALFLSSVFYLFSACSNYLPDEGCSTIQKKGQCNRFFPLCRKTCFKCQGKYDVTSDLRLYRDIAKYQYTISNRMATSEMKDLHYE